MKITISQIAKIAGVSRGTVDRVLHNRGSVSKETKEKILNIIDKYDYQPNAIGSALARNKSYKIGVILIEKHNSFFQIIKNGAFEAINTYKDYDIELEIRHISQVNENEYLAALDELEKSVDAFALIGLNTEKIIQKVNAIIKKGIPVMTMNIDLLNSLRQGFVGIDDYKGGMCIGSIVKDIVNKDGHILLLSGDPLIRSQKSRLEGFNHIMKKYPYFHLSDVYYTHDEPKEVYTLTKNALLNHDYQAIVAVCSQMNMIIEAIHDSHINNMPYIFGFDLVPDHSQFLAKGEISYIVDQSAFLQGKQTIIYICEYLIHHHSLPQGHQYLPIHIYNQYNV